MKDAWLREKKIHGAVSSYGQFQQLHDEKESTSTNEKFFFFKI